MSAILLLILFSFLASSRSHSDTRIITTLKHSKFYVKPTVINGIPARYGQVPYLVSIKEPLVKVSKKKYIWTNVCGGSIISASRVLTAAHCFEPRDFFFYKNPQNLRVVAGDFSTQLIHTEKTETNEITQWRKITKVVIHRKFFFPHHDIALAFVNKPFRYNMNVKYVRLASRRTDYVGDCIAAGFGSITHAENKVSPILLVGHMFLLPRTNCSQMYEMNMDNFVCSHSFMSDVGRGDSGGPLACTDTLDPAEKRGAPLLVGVVSGKNFDKTSLFTRVSQYNGWIARNGAIRRFSTMAVYFVVINFVLSAL